MLLKNTLEKVTIPNKILVTLKTKLISLRKVSCNKTTLINTQITENIFCLMEQSICLRVFWSWILFCCMIIFSLKTKSKKKFLKKTKEKQSKLEENNTPRKLTLKKEKLLLFSTKVLTDRSEISLKNGSMKIKDQCLTGN